MNIRTLKNEYEKLASRELPDDYDPYETINTVLELCDMLESLSGARITHDKDANNFALKLMVMAGQQNYGV